MNDFEYTPPRNQPISSDELISDLQRVSELINENVMTQKAYIVHGKYDVTTISRRFGSWYKTLKKIEMKPGNIVNYSDIELFENLLNIWQHKGKQPVRRDLSLPPSKISQQPYKRRFNSWSDTLREFVEYANGNEVQHIENLEKYIATQKKTTRDPSLRLRFKVLKRDNFCCAQCGASPSKDQNVELHVDHIQPWSKGGDTVLDNLQTLCLKCNLGKSNLE